MTWYMFSSILSLFRNEPESQYSECELSCGGRLFWILKRTTLKNAFLKPEYPFKLERIKSKQQTSITICNPILFMWNVCGKLPFLPQINSSATSAFKDYSDATIMLILGSLSSFSSLLLQQEMRLLVIETLFITSNHKDLNTLGLSTPPQT